MILTFVEESIKYDQNGRMDVFAKRLREKAAQLGMSIAETARRCGIGERRFTYYAAGTREPDLRSLVRIADTLDTSTDVLLGRDVSPKKDERGKMLDRLMFAGRSLTDEQLRLAAVQIEAIAALKPLGPKPGRPVKPLP